MSAVSKNVRRNRNGNRKPRKRKGSKMNDRHANRLVPFWCAFCTKGIKLTCLKSKNTVVMYPAEEHKSVMTLLLVLHRLKIFKDLRYHIIEVGYRYEVNLLRRGNYVIAKCNFCMYHLHCLEEAESRVCASCNFAHCGCSRSGRIL
jgi:hypothetical protein